MVYATYKRFHPRSPETAEGGRLKSVRDIIRECGSVEDACLYLEWVHLSPDEWATRIRGEAPWPGPEQRIAKMLSLEQLARHIEPRLAVAQAWVERGRTSAEPAPAPAVTSDSRAADAFERVRSVAASTTSRAAVLERLSPMELDLLHQVGGRAAVVKEPWQLRDTRARFIELYNRHPERVAT